MAERMVEANDIEIWTEEFGNASLPTVLLVMGASAQGIMWSDEVIQGLVDGGRHVIRYDNRDTGQSTSFDFAKDPYTVADMARDAVGVLDAYGVDRAHVVGASMGGMIGQTLAIEHPGRIHTLTSIMSSPGGATVAETMQSGEASDDALPPPTPEVMEAATAAMVNPPKTREERIESRIRMFQALAGSLDAFDVNEMRDLFEREHDRARNYEAMNNHGLAVATSPDRRAALRGVELPVLVIHGTEDPILPHPHGVATADAIPEATLLTVGGMGHDFPASALSRILDAILKHTS